jgi:hypothetical protein
MMFEMNCGLAGIKQMPEDVSNLKTIAAKETAAH